MSVKAEPMEEKNMVRLTIEVPAEEFESAMQEAYQKQKKDFNIPGFRKGKVPRNVIEKMFGPEVFYEEAVNIAIPEAYSVAAEESGEDIVSRPEIDIVQVEKGKPFIFTADVAVRPDVILGSYEGVEVTKRDAEPTEDEVDVEIKRELENNARIVSVEGRPVEMGDTAVIDFEGFLDGEPFEGGSGENHPLEIGSGTFIPGFEDQLIGKSVGDDVDVNVTFPDDYEPDFAGKDALFKVKIHEIKAKELPEPDDEFAQDVSEFDTMEEYRQSVREKLVEKKLDSLRHEQEEEALGQIVEASDIDIPEPMIDMQCENMINQFAQQLSGQGLTLEGYIEYAGTTYDDMMEQIRPDAERQLRRELVLDAIAEDAGIEITDEEIDEEIERMAVMYQMDPEQLRSYMEGEETENMKLDLAARKALELIGDTMVPVERAADEEAEESPESEDSADESVAYEAEEADK